MSSLKAEKGSLKDLDQKSREVFKPILENPFTKGPEFPVISKELASAILDHLLHLLPSYGNYLGLKDKKNAPAHPLNGKITIGFNSTVQALEKQASVHRDRLFKNQKNSTPKLATQGYIKYVFVARNDISTPLLTSIFPLLAFTSSRSNQDRVKLIDLPKGSMRKLLEALQTSNVGIVGISTEWTEGKELFALVEREIEDVDVPWLRGLFDGELDLFEKPDIKFLKTKVPVGKRPGKKERKQKAKKSETEAKTEEGAEGKGQKRKAKAEEGGSKKKKTN